MISFTIYLTFVLLFSSFLWQMYEMYEENDQIRIPVKLPNSCDPLQPTVTPAQRKGINLDSRMIGFDNTIDITNTGISTRGGNFSGKKDDDGYELKLEVVNKRKNHNTRVELRSSLCSLVDSVKRIS